MSQFKLHDVASAPAESKPLLEASRKAFGMIPNLHAVMAGAPGLLEGYKKLHELFEKSSLSPEEQTVVWQSINVEHGCHYCVPAHTGIARSMKVPDSVIDALRDQSPLPSPRLETLRNFVLKVVRQRGRVDDGDILAFLDAGFDRRQLLEVVLGVAQKTMSNYLNAIAETPLDEPFKKFEWHSVA
jgi:alkylhydroperoxidase family enzyme